MKNLTGVLLGNLDDYLKDFEPQKDEMNKKLDADIEHWQKQIDEKEKFKKERMAKLADIIKRLQTNATQIITENKFSLNYYEGVNIEF